MGEGEKICVLVDGGNFHHLVLKKLGIQESEFSFDSFINFLADGRKIIDKGKRFYVGTVREKEGDIRAKKAMSKQIAFLTRLNSFGWEIKTSKLRKRTEKIIIDDRVVGYKDILGKGIKEIEFERTREKGIDVKMATDLIAGAVDDKYDTAIVISSDTDLIPALDWVRNRKNKKIEYVGFSIIVDPVEKKKNTRPSQGMINYSDIQRILVVADLKQFIKKKIQSDRI